MNTIIDANIWISFLLSRGKNNTITRMIHRAGQWPFQIITPQETLTEITQSIGKSDYLVTRIRNDDVVELLAYIAQISTMPPLLQGEHMRIVRDQKDDYLIAYGLIYRCDYLITGDADLLSLGRIRDMQILTARQFVTLPASWDN